MGKHEPRTAADETAAAVAALADARKALRDLRSHLDRIVANPEGTAGNARSALRNVDIVAASLTAAEDAVHASDRQLRSVS
jgi:hypothetical protein